jgi:outer membrane protein
VKASYLFILLLPAGSAFAEPFTSEAYLHRAFELAPEVASSQQAFRAAQYQWKQAITDAWLPALSASANLNPWGYNPLNGNTWNGWQADAVDVGYSAGLTMNLFNSFYDWRHIRQLSLTRDAAAAVLDQTRQTIALNALTAYLDLFLKQKLKAVSDVDMAAQKAQYDLTLDYYRHGMKSKSDLLKSETDWHSSELRDLSTESDRKKSLYHFNLLINRPVEEPAELPELEQGPTRFMDVDEAVRRAAVERPELRQSAFTLKNSELNAQQAEQNFLPKLQATFNYNEARTPSFGIAGLSSTSRPYYYFGLALSLPVGYTGASQVYAYNAAKAQARQAAFDRATLLRTVKEGVHFARIALDLTIDSYRIGIERELIAQENLDIVLEQYREGSADVIRLSQARADYLQAQTDRLTFLHDTQLNWLQYRQAMGEPIWGP